MSRPPADLAGIKRWTQGTVEHSLDNCDEGVETLPVMRPDTEGQWVRWHDAEGLVSSLLAQLTEAQQEKENRRPVGEPSLVEQIATVIEVEEVDCRRKEHEGASHHARSIWGACAATCGVLAARVRGFQALEDAAEAHVADLARQLVEAKEAARYDKEAVQQCGRAMWLALDALKIHIGGFKNWPPNLQEAFSDAIIDQRPLTTEDIKRTHELAEQLGWERSE